MTYYPKQSNPICGPVTPNAPDSEQVVLASMLNATLAVPEVEAAGAGDLFFTPQLRALFNVIHRLAVEKAPHTAMEVRSRISDKDQDEQLSMLLLDVNKQWQPQEQARWHLEQLRIDANRRERLRLIDEQRTYVLEGNDLAANRIAERLANWTESSDHFEQLDSRRLDLTAPLAKPVPIFMLDQKIIATGGNLGSLLAQAKTGKTACLSAMITAAITQGHPDTFGFECDRDRKGAIIHFDTEQSRYDAWKMIERATRRAGLAEPPPWLRSYSLADVPPDLRRKWMAMELRRAADQWGCIHSVFVDGVADLAFDVNDIKEAASLVSELHMLAIKFDTVIICAIHENPNTMATGKARGHLGSELERKSESNLRLAREGEVTEIFMERGRQGTIPKGKGPSFIWSEDHAMHISNPESQKKTSAKEQRLFAMKELFAEILANDSLVAYTELHRMIMVSMPGRNGNQPSPKTVERYIREAGDEGLIRKDFATGKWRLNP